MIQSRLKSWGRGTRAKGKRVTKASGSAERTGGNELILPWKTGDRLRRSRTQPLREGAGFGDRWWLRSSRRVSPPRMLFGGSASPGCKVADLLTAALRPTHPPTASPSAWLSDGQTQAHTLPASARQPRQRGLSNLCPRPLRRRATGEKKVLLSRSVSLRTTSRPVLRPPSPYLGPGAKGARRSGLQCSQLEGALFGRPAPSARPAPLRVFAQRQSGLFQVWTVSGADCNESHSGSSPQSLGVDGLPVTLVILENTPSQFPLQLVCNPLAFRSPAMFPSRDSLRMAPVKLCFGF
ncbi:uncharacterized protein LOC125612035 [Marmota marmota marmota]|uniref:uncharacterized protein LOC125612035 n=1 Tax=Marmota marmota marmota TaxID=9994 RepID=UPI002093715C|nr:uncharacterized protein LOC125612035 [Marmota marmota marmota]